MIVIQREPVELGSRFSFRCAEHDDVRQLHHGLEKRERRAAVYAPHEQRVRLGDHEIGGDETSVAAHEAPERVDHRIHAPLRLAIRARLHQQDRRLPELAEPGMAPGRLVTFAG